MPTDIVRLHSVFDLAMRVGEGLLSNGAAASEVTATVLRIISSSGLRDVVVEVTFNQVSLSYLPDDYSTPFTRIRATGSRVQDFARLSAFEEVTEHYILGTVSLEEALVQVRSIPQQRPHYPRWLAFLGFAVMGGAAAFSFGGTILVVLTATLASGALVALTEVMAARQIPMFFGQAAGGLIGVVVAVVLHALAPAQNSAIVVVACIIVLLAGLASIGSMQDAITGWYVTASARILETLMLTVGIVVGVRAGLLGAELLGLHISVEASAPVTLASLVAAAVSGAVMGLGFAVGTFTPARVLGWMAMVSSVSAVVVYLLTEFVFDRVWASACAAFAVGVLAVLVARRVRAPALALMMGGIIPLVPGSRIYRGLLALSEDIGRGGAELFSAAEIAVAIAAGAVLGQLLATRVLSRRGAAGWAFTPVVATPFQTPRRRRLTLPRRRRRDAGRIEPSTMTGEMSALPPSVLHDLQQELDLDAPSGAVGGPSGHGGSGTTDGARRSDAPTQEDR
ncbi:threonine/serine exporter family protein [Brachybacterium subflavum]|uniref:threonine/serine ThrE exporter family protein n=1 Tax=Brachybacterium subflavum TaxID=2585206 RepID=UPI00126673DD|nr:threonine/serine exporter family protein [Brachybacterium subflavum]